MSSSSKPENPDNKSPSEIMNLKTPFPDWVPLFAHRTYGLFVVVVLLVVSWGALFLQILFTNVKLFITEGPPDNQNSSE